MPDPFDPARFGPVIADLLAETRIPPLGPGTPDEAALPQQAHERFPPVAAVVVQVAVEAGVEGLVSGDQQDEAAAGDE